MCGLFTFDLICLLVVGGEHIEGIDLFSTTTFGKFPMKNSFTHREFR